MIAQPHPRLRSVFRSCAQWIAATTALACTLLVLVRLSGASFAGDVVLASVQLGTSLVLVVSAAALWLAVDQGRVRCRVAAQLGAAFVTTVGLVLLGDFFIQRNAAASLPLVGSTVGSLWTLIAGRMAPNTALSFVLLGVALLSLDVETRRGHRPAQFFALATAVISLLAVIGYVYGLAPFYRIASAAAMPRHVAVTFLALSAGILFARPEGGLMRVVASETSGGLLVRWLPAAVFGVPLLFGWLTLAGQRAGFYTLDFGISVFVILNTVFFSILTLWTALSLDRADLRRSRAEDELRVRASQQAGVAELSQRALSGTDLTTLMREAVTLVAGTLDAHRCELLETAGDNQTLVLRAGIGWKPGDIGRAVADGSSQQLHRYTLTCREPVIVIDLRSDSRFGGPGPTRLDDVVSGLSVIIHGRTGPFGVLAAYTGEQRIFTKDDILFLQTVAAVLGTAVDRERADEALRLSEEKFASAFRS